jgi:hypothetical protein
MRIPALLLILLIGACTCPKPPIHPTTRGAVKLTVSPSAPRFAPGTPITLTLDFENVGTADVRLSTVVDGNLHLVTLRRNGKSVIGRQIGIRLSNDLATLIAKNDTKLAPGAHTQLTWSSRLDPEQNTQALQVVRFDPEGNHTGQLAAVGNAGTYTLNVVYRHADPWTQPDSVFTGETNVAAATFEVGP